MDMIRVCIYCDTTPWYTQEEMNEDNLCELLFPRKLVEDFYNSTDASDGNCFGKPKDFADWLDNYYTADDTDGLFAYCQAHGFTAQRD